MIKCIKRIRKKHLESISEHQEKIGFNYAWKVLCRYGSVIEIELELEIARRNGRLNHYMIGYDKALVKYKKETHV